MERRRARPPPAASRSRSGPPGCCRCNAGLNNDHKALMKIVERELAAHFQASFLTPAHSFHRRRRCPDFCTLDELRLLPILNLHTPLASNPSLSLISSEQAVAPASTSGAPAWEPARPAVTARPPPQPELPSAHTVPAVRPFALIDEVFEGSPADTSGLKVRRCRNECVCARGAAVGAAVHRWATNSCASAKPPAPARWGNWRRQSHIVRMCSAVSRACHCGRSLSLASGVARWVLRGNRCCRRYPKPQLYRVRSIGRCTLGL